MTKRQSKENAEDVVEQLEIMKLGDIPAFSAKDYSQEDRFKIVCARMANQGLSSREACEGVMSRTAFNDLLREANKEAGKLELEFNKDYGYEERGKLTWILNRYARAKQESIEYWEDEARKVAYDNDGDLSHVKLDWDANKKPVVIVKENREFVSRSKLKMDYIMWKLLHLAPEKYGKVAKGEIRKDENSDKLVFDINLGGPSGE